MTIEEYMIGQIHKSVNLAVPFYIMAAYAYYKEDDPIISDHAFDNLASIILEHYDEITHPHKSYLDRGTLEAGTYLGNYPSMAVGGLKDLRQSFT